MFGRLVSGVAAANVCTQDATRDHVTGEFVHAEQDAAARGDANFPGWTAAVKATFTAVCQAGMSVDSGTGLCV
jgi:hypothetical protein